MKKLTLQLCIRLVYHGSNGIYSDALENNDCISSSLNPLWLLDEARLKQTVKWWKEC